MHFGLGLDWRPSGTDSEFKISTRKKEEKEKLQKESDNLLYDEEDFSADCFNFKKVYTYGTLALKWWYQSLWQWECEVQQIGRLCLHQVWGDEAEGDQGLKSNPGMGIL